MLTLNEIQVFPAALLRELRGGASNPLFERFPRLADRVPWLSLGTFPTPVEELPGMARDDVFVKRDDLSCLRCGGNKVRKLEFLLAEAQLSSRRTLITLGGLGSNHGLATAVHGGSLGFAVDLVLYDQPLSEKVTRTLGGFVAAGARLHHAGSTPAAFLVALRLFLKRAREGGAPHFIMVGGTSRLGCLGYVSAAFELAQQVSAGLLPRPDVIFVPLGTTGTAAGLIAGLKLAGLRTRVAAVRVADRISANSTVVRFFAQDVLDFLSRADPSVPALRVRPDDFEVITDYFGPGYGHPTAAAEDALRKVAPRLRLETTYTGKTLAACLDYCGRREIGRSRSVLFWNTFSSAPVAEPGSWESIPPSLRHVLPAAHEP